MVLEADCPYRSLRECESREDYESDNGRMERNVKTLSRGLVEVVSSNQNQIVQFIHQSVKDFFVDKGLSALSRTWAEAKSSGADLEGIAHYRLSRTCIRYLAMEEIAEITQSQGEHELISAFPLLQYATTSWVAHVKQSEARGASQDDLLVYFAWPSEALVQLWVRVYRTIGRYSVARPVDGTTMIHIVSRYQLMGPLQAILQKADGASIESKDEHGRTPLSYAAAGGDGRTPLSSAAAVGHEANVKLLIEKGAAVDSKDKYGRTPLSYAAAVGHKAIVKLLIEKGAAIDSEDKDGRTPLSYAAARGHEAIAKLLQPHS